MLFRFFEKLVDPFPESKTQQIVQPFPTTIFAFIWACTKGTRIWLLLIILLSAAIGAFEAFLYTVLGKVIDWLSISDSANFWTEQRWNLIALALILLLSIVVVALQSILRHQTIAGNFPMRLRWRFHQWLLNQSMAFYQDEFAGRIATKVMQTALAVRGICILIGDVLTFVCIAFVSMSLIFASIDSRLLLPLLAWLLAYCCMLSYFVPRLVQASEQQSSHRSLMTGRITDAYTNISTVKLFSHAGREAKHAKSAMRDFLTTVDKQMRLITLFEIANHSLAILLLLSTFGLAIMLWAQGSILIGAVAAVGGIAIRLMSMSKRILWEVTSLFEYFGTIHDGLSSIAKQHSIQDAPNAKNLVVKQGGIEFKQINFYYNREKPIFNNFSLTVGPGEKVGLVGHSGSGKSSLIQLLLRFYDPQSGTISIDQQNIAQVTQNSLRAQIGMVTQDTSLLHRSIRENIVYGRPNASEEEIIAACKQAEAHDFILELRDANGRRGYDTLVGERGIKLSGGQRQRIAIARVILKNAPILLLDEATSALDSEVENAIQSNLSNLMRNKTVIAIAHRLSTVAAMDRLIVLEHGEIVEQGSHEELLQRNGVYSKLWQHQSGGFLMLNQQDD